MDGLNSLRRTGGLVKGWNDSISKNVFRLSELNARFDSAVVGVYLHFGI